MMPSTRNLEWFTRGVSGVSSLSYGYSDGSMMHDGDFLLDIDLLKFSGLPTKYPALSHVISLPISGSGSECQSHEVTSDENSSYNIPSETSEDLLFSSCIFEIDEHTFDAGTLHDTSYPHSVSDVENILQARTRPTTGSLKLQKQPNKRAMDLFFPSYSCGDVLNLSSTTLQTASLCAEVTYTTGAERKDTTDKDNSHARNNHNTNKNINNYKKNSQSNKKLTQTISPEDTDDSSSVLSQTTSRTQQSEYSTASQSLLLPTLQVIEHHTHIESSALSLQIPRPPTPLSPDALSAFGRTDPLYKECDEDVRDATSLLVEQLIPAMALDLQMKVKIVGVNVLVV